MYNATARQVATMLEVLWDEVPRIEPSRTCFTFWFLWNLTLPFHIYGTIKMY